MPRLPTSMIFLAFGAAVVVLAAGLAAWGFETGVLRINHPSRDRFPVQGVDVSNHQRPIDWPQVRRQGFSFAYVKATEGGDYVDARFAQHTEGARGAGLRVGAYHFFTFCRPGVEQARNVIGVVGPQRLPGDLPLVVDLEFAGNCSHTPTAAELDREFGVFDAQVTAAFGAPPVLYLTEDFRHRYIDGAAARGSALAGHRLWIRDIVGGPGHGCDRWAFWQFADKGRVDGVDGPVDLNVYCGSTSAFTREFPTS